MTPNPPEHGATTGATHGAATGATYRDAGVDIEAGDSLVERIKPLARGTARPGVVGGIGGFGALFDPRSAGFHDPVLVATTDGVGTKLKLAAETGRHGTVGVDLVALPRWRLPAGDVGGDVVATETVLGRAGHVLAVPEGENAWIMRVERFLRREAGDVGARLRGEGP